MWAEWAGEPPVACQWVLGCSDHFCCLKWGNTISPTKAKTQTVFRLWVKRKRSHHNIRTLLLAQLDCLLLWFQIKISLPVNPAALTVLCHSEVLFVFHATSPSSYNMTPLRFTLGGVLNRADGSEWGSQCLILELCHYLHAENRSHDLSMKMLFATDWEQPPPHPHPHPHTPARYPWEHNLSQHFPDVSLVFTVPSH